MAGHEQAEEPLVEGATERAAAPVAKRETASEVIADFLDPFMPRDTSAYKVALDLHRYLREQGWEIKHAGDDRG